MKKVVVVVRCTRVVHGLFLPNSLSSEGLCDCDSEEYGSRDVGVGGCGECGRVVRLFLLSAKENKRKHSMYQCPISGGLLDCRHTRQHFNIIERLQERMARMVVIY